MKRRVTAPDGSTWIVRRRRHPVDDTGDEAEDEDGEDRDLHEWALAAAAFGIVVVATVVDPRLGLLFLVGELLFTVVGGVIWLLRDRGRLWYVEATAPSSQTDLRWEVGGRRRSRAIVDEVALALERGHLDVDPLGATRL
ncbi:MAG: hypothetical protein ACRDNA_05780 [Gaiellaceae bacterium]